MKHARPEGRETGPGGSTARRGVPIRWQIALLIVVAQLIAVAGTFLLLGSRDHGLPVPTAVARDGLAPFTAVVGTIESLPPEARSSAIGAALAHEPRLRVMDAIAPLAPGEGWGPGTVARGALDAALGRYPEATLAIARSGTAASLFGRLGYLVAYQLPDGRWLTFAPGETTIVRTLPPAILTLLGTLLASPLVVLFVWAGATLVAPLARLAEGTERFGADLTASPPKPEGPREVRILARTIAAMRARILELLDARTMSLAAIGHDLRTPLTRLRLRMEGVADEPLRDAMLRDADAMARMIDRGLDYLRDRRREPERRAYDLMALVRTVADDAEVANGENGEASARIAVDGPRRLVRTGDPAELRRALENLVGNALAHGSRCRISVKMDGDTASVMVSDDGPGIPFPDRDRVLEPFERGEPARSNQQEGLGLGLSIARDIVVSAGGTIELAEASEGGLAVTVRLPPAFSHAPHDQASY